MAQPEERSGFEDQCSVASERSLCSFVGSSFANATELAMPYKYYIW